MIEVECLGSGSKGNCYIVHQDGFTYLLDAGIVLKKVVAKINLNKIDFVFISHKHKDHSLNEENLDFRGVKILKGINTREFEEIGYNKLKNTKIKVYAFPIYHGECKNFGLIVQTENECLLYATDFSICKYNLKQFKFTEILVECNYDEELMKLAVKDYKLIRQINTHMGFNGLKTFIAKAVDISNAKEILLIHLSNQAGLIDKEIILDKAKLEWKNKKIGICLQRGGVYFGG